jgi:hypothetical protein
MQVPQVQSRCVRVCVFISYFIQLLKTHDYVDDIWQPAEVLPLLPLVTAPAFIQSGYFDFMLQVRRFEFALQRCLPCAHHSF